MIETDQSKGGGIMEEGTTKSKVAVDVLNIAGELIPDLDPVLSELLDRGRHERVLILSGTEGGHGRKPYAVTKIEIKFDQERDLRNCVRLLRWSDDRLRARPDQLVLWDWERSYREGDAIFFGVTWYDKSFFERRKDAFKEPGHAAYYSMFGATPDSFKMTHTIVGE